MNKERRSKILQVIKEIETVKNSLQNILDDEENTFDNMPENLQCSARGEESEESIECMDEAVEALNTAIEQLENI